MEAIELWVTPCIVLVPPMPSMTPREAMAAVSSRGPSRVLDTLVNPANETLVGTALAYFPKGGPTPMPPPPGGDLNWYYSDDDDDEHYHFLRHHHRRRRRHSPQSGAGRWRALAKCCTANRR